LGKSTTRLVQLQGACVSSATRRTAISVTDASCAALSPPECVYPTPARRDCDKRRWLYPARERCGLRGGLAASVRRPRPGSRAAAFVPSHGRASWRASFDAGWLADAGEENVVLLVDVLVGVALQLRERTEQCLVRGAECAIVGVALGLLA
jgi:hypothetical protein